MTHTLYESLELLGKIKEDIIAYNYTFYSFEDKCTFGNNEEYEQKIKQNYVVLIENMNNYFKNEYVIKNIKKINEIIENDSSIHNIEKYIDNINRYLNKRKLIIYFIIFMIIFLVGIMFFILNSK